jgi:hypothetical protein
MSTTVERRAPEAASGDSPLAALVAEIEAFLTARREALAAEIRGYPTPIPRCDAQFNFLYEQRSRIGTALNAIAERCAGGRTPAACRQIVGDFLAEPAFSDLPAEAALRSRAARAGAESALPDGR